MNICVLKDGDDNITTTAYELARLAAVTADFVSNFIISFDDGTPITEDGDGAAVIAAADTGSFANGAGADHVLTSTGTQIDAAVAVAPEYVATFSTATAAQGKLTLVGNVTADDEVTIGSITYKFVAVPAAAYDVAIAGSASDTINNLIAAITAREEGVGTAYGAGTVAHPEVTAAAGQGDTMTVTALVKGAAGNAIGTTDPKDDAGVMSWGEVHLQNGVDGQVGATGKIIFTDNTVYFCTDGEKCVIADSSGWRKAALGLIDKI